MPTKVSIIFKAPHDKHHVRSNYGIFFAVLVSKCYCCSVVFPCKNLWLVMLIYLETRSYASCSSSGSDLELMVACNLTLAFWKLGSAWSTAVPGIVCRWPWWYSVATLNSSSFSSSVFHCLCFWSMEFLWHFPSIMWFFWVG